MPSCACSPTPPQQLQAASPLYGGYMEVSKPRQIPECPCHAPSQQPPFCPPPQPPCYTGPRQSNCPPEMQYTSTPIEDKYSTLADIRNPKNVYYSPTHQTTVPSVSTPSSKVSMPSKYACPENVLPEDPSHVKVSIHYEGMPVYCCYSEKNKSTNISEHPTKENELLKRSALEEKKYYPKKSCICIPPLADTTSKAKKDQMSQKCSCNKTNQFYFPDEKHVLQKGMYSDPQERKSCSPYEGSEQWGPNAFERPNFMKIEDQAKKFYVSNLTTCHQQHPEKISPQNSTADSKFKIENTENITSTCTEKYPTYKPSEYISEVCDEAAMLETERARKLYKEYPQHEHCKVISRELPDKYPEVLCYCPLEKHQKSADNKEKICSHNNPECTCCNFTPGLHAMKDTERAKHCPNGKPDCTCPKSELKVLKPHQIPEHPYNTPSQQPPCYKGSKQCNCSPEMQFTSTHVDDKNSTLANVRNPKNVYYSPTLQTSVPSVSTPSSKVLMPSKYACPENVLPEDPSHVKGSTHYEGMPVYCCYSEKNKSSNISEHPTKENELLKRSTLEEKKYYPKKSCICIPPLADTTSKAKKDQMSQKCSCNKTNQFYFPDEKHVLQKGMYSDPQERKSCSPYEGSEQWGPNAFERPNFMKIEDQAKKFYVSNLTTCHQQHPEKISPQNSTADSKFKIENTENITGTSTCTEQYPTYKPSEYISEVCDEAAMLETERARKLYKEYPQHEHCKVISRELPDKYPEVLCYCPLEKHQKSADNKEKICSHNNPECTCRNFTPGLHAMKEIDRAKRCPNRKPDCTCPESELKDIDPCTGNLRNIETKEHNFAVRGVGNSCHLPENDSLAPGELTVQSHEGVICAGVPPHAQSPLYIPQPENRTVDTQAACQPAPCICDTPPCQQHPKPVTAEIQDSQKMGIIGPWATGRMDWGPLSGLTGTRPVVDKYSISRYSEGEWCKHNADVLGGAEKEIHHANMVDFNGRQCAAYTAADTDKKQNDNNKRLSQRAHDMHRSKNDLERALISMADEINLLEMQRQRLKTAMGVLRLPESIAGECLARRTGRLEPDLVRDRAEEELIKEASMIAEIRNSMERMLKQMEEQLRHDKAIKHRTEMEWSDKKEAYDIEAVNIGLRNTSTTLLFKPGATRFPEGQSTLESWEHYTKENLDLLQAELDRSSELRSYLESFLANMIRDLRMQADSVDAALAMRIAETNEVRQRLENELLKTLRRIADTEKLIADMKQAIKNQDAAMKKAQTRLDNRLLRPGQENCRDIPQYGLMNEVKSIGESVSAVKTQLQQAEESLQGLLKTRGNLEKEIIVKRKTLYIDRERCQEIRSHYPSTVALTGH